MAFSKKVGRGTFHIRYRKETEGGYSGQCVELPGAISQGETLEELKSNMKEAIELVLEVMEEKSKKEKIITVDVSV